MPPPDPGGGYDHSAGAETLFGRRFRRRVGRTWQIMAIRDISWLYATMNADGCETWADVTFDGGSYVQGCFYPIICNRWHFALPRYLVATTRHYWKLYALPDGRMSDWAKRRIITKYLANCGAHRPGLSSGTNRGFPGQSCKMKASYENHCIGINQGRGRQNHRLYGPRVRAALPEA